ncbi:MAG TPA: ComEC/Rec2 family competence protein, partial [Candidatus Bathyarchaeia archaeon]|nr:ComEC/Rec2 family competence protein [Candidatus Bathyarchaeia archaeon]
NVRYVLVVLLIVLYVPLTGARASVLRSGMMAAVYLFSFVLERTRSSVNILGLAGLLILLANPLDLFSVGFQLSFLAVFALIVLSPELDALLKPVVHPALDSIRVAVSVSWAAWIGVLGCVAYYFEMVTPIGMIANLIIVPLTNVFIGLSAILVLTGGWFPLCALLISRNLQVLLRLIVCFLYYLDMFPGGWFKVRSMSLGMCVMYYVLLGGLVIWMKGKKRKKPSDFRRPLS